MNDNSGIKHQYSLLLLAFLEGSAVMACELSGGKMLTPVFGSSLFVWASVLGITLLALTSGYFLGGLLSYKLRSKHLVHWLLLNAGFLLFLMPFSGEFMLKVAIDMGIYSGAILCLLVFMLPPLVLMGASTPVIINSLTENVQQSGNISGKVYGISTLGGIIATFLTGFYLLPDHGIKMATALTGIILAALPLAFLLMSGKYFVVTYLLLGSFIQFKSPTRVSSQKFNVVYESEGILGQLKVVDHYWQTESGWKPGRGLLVNNTNQTIMDLNDPGYSLWEYAYFFPAPASRYPPGSNALLLGLGGGTLVKQLQRLSFNLDVVEIDQRIKEIAMNYFHVDKNTNIIVDDGRHFINITEKQYDVIVFDLFLGESPPPHLLTLECFNEVKRLLSPDGLLIIHVYNYIEGELGRGTRSVYKTLVEAGLNTRIFSVSKPARNFILLASKNEIDFSGISFTEQGRPLITNLEQYFVDPAAIDWTDALVLKDNTPVFDYINAPASLEWRKTYNRIYTSAFMKEGVPIYE